MPGIGINGEEDSCNGPVDVIVGLAGICRLPDAGGELGALVGSAGTCGPLDAGGAVETLIDP